MPVEYRSSAFQMHAQPESSATSINGIIAAFCVLGAFGVLFGSVLLVGGTFVGAHILIAGAAFFGTGSVSLLVDWGLLEGYGWARLVGLLVSAGLVGLCLIHAYAILRHEPEAFPALIFDAAFGVLFLAVLYYRCCETSRFAKSPR